MAKAEGQLEGYLVLRPSGTFGRLKARKRQWYIYDEQNQQLLYYPSNTSSDPPSGSISLRNVAISLVLEEDNSFVLHTDGKEYTFISDDQNSMLEWIYTLQSKRDNCPKGFLRQESAKELREKYLTNHNSRNLSFLRSKIQLSMERETLDQRQIATKPLTRTQSLYVSQNTTEKLSLRKADSTPPETVAARDSHLKNQDAGCSEPDSNNNNETESQTVTFPLKIESGKTVCKESEDSENLEENYTSCFTSPMTSSEDNEEKFVVLRHLNYAKKHREQMENQAHITDEPKVCKSTKVQDCLNVRRVKQLEMELMDVKCELAKAVNRATIYKNKVLSQERDLEYLKEKIQEMDSEKALENNLAKCIPGILESQNRFLNEEVIKLSRQIQEQDYKYQTQQFQAKEMEASLEQLKRDYVFLMQSAMRPTVQEGPEQMEVYLYGGTQHKRRVIQLLNEARTVNQILPVYDNASTCLCHVDSMGFQHCYTEEQVTLHYICRQLYNHYITKIRTYQLHQLRWKEYLKRHGVVLKPEKELKELVRGGIPNQLRSRVWCYLYRYRVKNMMDKAGSHYYNNLCSLAPDSKIVAQSKRQISLDLLRTLPNNVRFSHTNGDGVRKMQEVLQSFCLHNPDLGYCQGMNFLVAICLLFMDAENAFWCLVAIVERYFPSGYYDCNLIGAQVDQEVLKDLMKEKIPSVYQHLESFDIEICTITLNWFLAIFFDSAPIETVLRIWDCFLLEGPKVIFRFALAIIKMQEIAILSKKDAVSVMRQVKTAAKLCFDADALIKVAFEELEPFPCRKDIAARQAYYLKSITERILKQDRERINRKLHRTESEMEKEESNSMFIECATLIDTGKLLICYGSQHSSKVAKVNCEENIMYNLHLQFDSRIRSVHALCDSLVLFGSISSQVYAYSTKLRKRVWEVALNDSVLSMASELEKGRYQVYAGLADGTVAVIQKDKDSVSKPETFYVSVGSSPVASLCLIQGKLWCASGNRIVVLSLKTFDIEDNFQTSTNGMDYVSLVVLGSSGVWITLRGSSVVQLWDHQDLSCRLLFDVAKNQITKNSQTDADNGDASFAVSSLLQVNGCVIVGTDEGSILFYDVTHLLSRSCSTVYTPGSIKSIEETPGRENLAERKDVIVDPFFRERNDSGCYSSTTTTLTLSRRESCTGTVSDKADYEICCSTLIEQTDSNSPEPTPECDRPDDDNPPNTSVEINNDLNTPVVRNNTARTNSDASTNSTVVDSGILSSDNVEAIPISLDTVFHLPSGEHLATALNSGESALKTTRRHLSDTSDSDLMPNGLFGDLDTLLIGRRRTNTGFNRHLYQLTTLGSTVESIPSKQNSRSSSVHTSRYSKLVAEVQETRRRLKRKYRERRLSMPDARELSPRKPSLFRWKSINTIGAVHFASAETLCSIATWDSYEYDDLFVAYTDDEFGKPLATIPRISSTELRESTNLLLDSLRLLDKERPNATNFEEPTTNDAEYNSESKTNQSNVIVNIGEVEPKENGSLRHNRSWTSCDGSKVSSTANGGSNEDSTSTADYPINSKPSRTHCHLDFLRLNEWSTATNGMRGAASDTASVLSSTSTEQPYSIDLALVEKIKISDKAIKCILKTTCDEELTVISCSGCYDDDEAILKWTRDEQDKLWTNDPVVEVCPYTNRMRPSMYVRSRLPRRASVSICEPLPTVSSNKTKPAAKRVKSETAILSRTTRSASASQILTSLFSLKSSMEKKNLKTSP